MYAFQVQFDGLNVVGRCLVVQSAKHGIVEFVISSIGRQRGRLFRVGRITQTVETVQPRAVNDRVDGAAAVAAELMRLGRLDQTGRHWQPAMGAAS